MTKSKHQQPKKKKPQKINYCLHDNAVYQEYEKPLYSCWKNVDIPEADETFTGFTWKGPKIPYDLWTYIVLFHRYSVKKLNSETLNFLFFDPDNKEEPWQCWVPPQKTSGMSVETNTDHELYDQERKKYHSLQFGTVHNHVNISAFQSGTDEMDEMEKEGFHITIGDCDEEVVDIHVRAIMEQEQYDINIADIVELPDWMKSVPEKYRKHLVVDKLFSVSLDDYDEKSVAALYDPQLTKVSRHVVSYPKNKKNSFMHQQGSLYIGGTTDHPWESDFHEVDPHDQKWLNKF